jgi:hypothetical protein
MGVDRRPIEHEPDKWRGELDGHHIRRDGDPIPVTVKVTWSDGPRARSTGSRRSGPTHVCVVRETAPPYHPFWVRASDVGRR